MKVGFIGLGNVGAKLAGTLQRNGVALTVRDLDQAAAKPFLDRGAAWAGSAKQLAESVDVVITCLPSPAICAAVLEADDGVLAGLSAGKIWLEMSTTDADEVRRLGGLVSALGAVPMDCPVSGGCHRAATGNIAILAGGARSAFDRVLPILTMMGRQVLHTGDLGTASELKVVTNYLATANLVALGEALVVAGKAGLDLATTYEAIRISSGNSFVHETETQVILNGSYNISFTMDLVLKDVGLFQNVARNAGVALEVAPLLTEIFRDGAARFGPRAWSSMIIRRHEEACGIELRAAGFPAELTDSEPEERGREVVVPRP